MLSEVGVRLLEGFGSIRGPSMAIWGGRMEGRVPTLSSVYSADGDDVWERKC